MDLATNAMGRAGLGRADIFENLIGQTEPGCENLKMRWASANPTAHPLKM